MADAQFMPASPALQFSNNVLGLAEGYQNLFARAEAIGQSRERFEMEKKRFAQESTLRALDFTRAELEIKRQTSKLAIEEYSQNAERTIVDAREKQAKADIFESEAGERLLASLDQDLQSLTEINEDDLDGLLSKQASISRRYGHLAQGKFANRFFEKAGSALTNLQTRIDTAQVLRERQANAALFDLRAALAAGDDQAIQRVLNDPKTRAAALSPGEAGKALSAEISAGVKQMMTSRAKVDEAKVKAETKATEEAKSTSVPGFTGTARSKEAAKAVAEESSAANTSIQLITELEDILAQVSDDPAKLADPALRGRAANVAKLIQATNRLAIVGPGAVTEAEWKILEQFAENPTNTKLLVPFFQRRAKSGFQTTREALLTKLFNTAEAQGLKYDPTYWTPDAIRSRKDAAAKVISGESAKEQRKLPDGSVVEGEVTEMGGKKVFKYTDSQGRTRYFSAQ